MGKGRDQKRKTEKEESERWGKEPELEGMGEGEGWGSAEGVARAGTNPGDFSFLTPAGGAVGISATTIN